jgi:hypothetical protein
MAKLMDNAKENTGMISLCFLSFVYSRYIISLFNSKLYVFITLGKFHLWQITKGRRESIHSHQLQVYFIFSVLFSIFSVIMMQ